MKYDDFCNKYNNFFDLICDSMVDDDNIAIAEFGTKNGFTSKALSYLLPQVPIDVFDSDESSLRRITDFLNEDVLKRDKSAPLSTHLWDIQKKQYPYKDYQIIYTHNFFNTIPERDVGHVWDQMKVSGQKMFHCVDAQGYKDFSYYLTCLSRRFKSIRNINDYYILIG